MSVTAHHRLSQVKRDLEEGSVWDYFDGGSYKVHSLELNATGYEESHTVGIVVVYEQLDAGEFPRGQTWIRSLEDFQGTVSLSGRAIPKFTKRSRPV